MMNAEHGRRKHSLLGVLALLAMLLSLLPQQAVLAARPSEEAGPAVVDDHTPDPTSVTLAGSFQQELGCSGDWQPECATTNLTYNANDDVWQGSFTIDAGSWAYKAALNGTWTESYGRNGDNATFANAASQSVKFYYDHKTHWVADTVANEIVTIPGSFQQELGCSGDWDPTCLRTWAQDADNDGIYTFQTDALPVGTYEGKAAHDEDWAENYGVGGAPGGSNYSFTVAVPNSTVTFSYNIGTHVLTINIVAPGSAEHDNSVWWSELGHNSRDGLYRSPAGPVTTGTTVTLRLRTAANDLTAVRARVWDDLRDTQLMLNMESVLNDGTYEWWEAELPVGAEPTIYWYRFIVTDGTDTDYYEDDAARDLGWGEALEESTDRSWQLTVYDPSFQTPDWVKNGVMYQIFVDRFRDGNPSNNTPAGTFFYGDEDATIYRSNATAWNTSVCDPRTGTGAPVTCANKYSDNFYGGDLQGITEQINAGYFSDLGVSILYLNPIFEAPSNHKYDTTDYMHVDDNFGGDAAFAALVQAADAQGLKIVLDGVFNHTSSDSIYFDRYSRYPEVGACESHTSPYRSWFYFHAEAGGPCVGDDGTPNAANYESWFGYDSLPKLRATNTEMRNLIWAQGTNSVAPYWLEQGADGWRLDVGGDVDPGETNDPNNTYWEGFRDAVRAQDPEGYIVGEEWGNASPWQLGQEWDATMNYQTSSAIMSFWRDETFTDNDHNTGSSAGELTPLSPSQLDNRLHALAERYPPESLYAQMNLLGSHDTNRPMFMLDHNADQNNRAIYDNANYDWSDAALRLKGTVLLQMTLPGAPTIYYGDEVGLIGPSSYAGGKWEDDPYNRVPYPWLDQSGTPFYTHLRTQTGQNAMLNYYKTVIDARNDHEALRTGDFRTLLVDDASSIYAYGRRSATDGAVVIANSSNQSRSVTVDVGGYLPEGAVFVNVLGGNTTHTVTNGDLTVTVPPMGGALLVAQGQLETVDAPATLTATGATGGIQLNWGSAVGDSYNIYRSLVSGGGYQYIGNTDNTSYLDTTAGFGQRYYYVVTTVGYDDTESAYSNEDSALRSAPIGYAVIQFPPSINHTLGVTPTQDIYGRVYVNQITDTQGNPDLIMAQVGYGPDGSDPSTWTTWEDMEYNVTAGSNYEYQGHLRPEAAGNFDYLVRFSTDLGDTWAYGDVDGMFPGEPGTDNPGTLTVSGNPDITPPPAPTLSISDWSPSSISLTWTEVLQAEEYWIYRREGAGTYDAEPLVKLTAPITTYTDFDVTNGVTYTYKIHAVSHSLTPSAPSNEVTQRAESKMVNVVFRVRVPSYTPEADIVRVVGDIAQLNAWNESGRQMTEVSPGIWEYTTQIIDGTTVMYKYNRGSWNTVEWWGDIVSTANRSFVVNYGTNGTHIVDNTATDWGNGADEDKAVQFWRDALVISHSPSATLALADTIEVTWATAVTATGNLSDVIVVRNSANAIVPGTVTAVDADTFRWTRAATVPTGTITVTAFNVKRDGIDGGNQQQPYTFTLNVAGPSTHTLTVNKAGTGEGLVISTPAGIHCGSDCSEAYTAGMTVTLQANGAASSTFTGWSGACTGTNATCVVTMDQAKSVTATFTLVKITFSLTKAGNGQGTVTSTPAGINCGNTCTAQFDFGTVITLTATPDAGSTFTGWSGACTGTNTTCSFTLMPGVSNVFATFTQNTPEPAEIKVYLPFIRRQ